VICSECGSRRIVECWETGEIVCGSCGLVLDMEGLDTRAEWRAYTLEEAENRIRISGPLGIHLPNGGISTAISLGLDSHKHRLPPSTWQHMSKLRRLQTWVNAPPQRSLSQALAELTRLADRLHIPEDLREEAAEIYRKALDKNLVRGRFISVLVAATVYAACRIHGRPRSLKEIASTSGVKKKAMAKCYRLLLNKLDVKAPIQDPKTYLSKIAVKANIPVRTQMRAIQLLGEAERRRVVEGKDPAGLAAAALYVACVLTGEKKTQRDVAEAAGVTEVTVRNRVHSLNFPTD